MHKEHLPSPWFRENFLNKITPGPNFWSKQSENWEKTRWKGHSQTPMTHFYQFGLKKKPEKGNVETVFQRRLYYLCTLVYLWFVHLCWTTWLGSAVVLYFKCFIYFALHGMCVLCAKLLQLGLTLCDPMDCSPPGSSLHGILQARMLEWVAMPSSRGPSSFKKMSWLGLNFESKISSIFWIKSEGKYILTQWKDIPFNGHF